MITVIVSGVAGPRERIAAKITELLQTMGTVVLHYPQVDRRPPQYPENLEVAIFETSSTPEVSRG